MKYCNYFFWICQRKNLADARCTQHYCWCTQHFFKISKLPLLFLLILKVVFFKKRNALAIFAQCFFFVFSLGCAMLRHIFFVFLRLVSFGEGEGASVRCCGGWFVVSDIRGTHLCWVCVRVVRKSYGSSWSVCWY